MGKKHDKVENPTEGEAIPPAMAAFAQSFNSALAKLKYANETSTNALLANDEVDALLEYLKAAATEWRRRL